MGGRKRCSENELRLRAALAIALRRAIGESRGSLSRAAEHTGICKQSISLYLNQKATPTPETLRVLCSALKISLKIEGAVISPDDLRPSEPIRRNVQLPLALQDAISSVQSERLQVHVLKRRASSIDLKVTIDFDQQRRKSVRKTGSIASVA